MAKDREPPTMCRLRRHGPQPGPHHGPGRQPRVLPARRRFTPANTSAGCSGRCSSSSSAPSSSAASRSRSTPAKAKLYGIALGGVVFLAMMKFMEYPPGSSLARVRLAINLGHHRRRLVVGEQADLGLHVRRRVGRGRRPRVDGAKLARHEPSPTAVAAWRGRIAKTAKRQTRPMGRLGRVLLARRAAAVRPRPVADPGRGRRPPALRLLAHDRLRRQRPRPAADDEPARPAPLPAAAEAADAGRDDRPVARRRRAA